MILIKDDEFIRGKCPMTKEDIRSLSLWKMNLKEAGKVLDIGSGTGTITVQASKLINNGMVYSVERDEEAFEITKKNIKKFNCSNVITHKGEATEILQKYIDDGLAFDSIFIGGSGGNIEEIIKKCSCLIKEEGTIVTNFITLDNAYKAMEAFKKLGFKLDVSLVNISKNREGSYMMVANNPIYIVQCIRGDR